MACPCQLWRHNDKARSAPVAATARPASVTHWRAVCAIALPTLPLGPAGPRRPVVDFSCPRLPPREYRVLPARPTTPTAVQPRLDGMAIIQIQGLVKRYGPVTAVDNLSFDVQPGTVTGFLGPNGAGKTTTLRMLLGLVAPDAGSGCGNGRGHRDPGEAHHPV